MSHDSREFQPLGGRVVHQGHIIEVAVERFRHADGEEVVRDVVRHPGAVGVVAHDGEHVYLVRQPREVVGEPDMLEIPAGKLDEEGEEPLETAQRELAEEIGKAAGQWKRLTWFYTSVGVLDERVTLYVATDLRDEPAEAEENERIEIVPWPLADLDRAIEESHDSKTLIGLLLLKGELGAA